MQTCWLKGLSCRTFSLDQNFGPSLEQLNTEDRRAAAIGGFSKQFHSLLQCIGSSVAVKPCAHKHLAGMARQGMNAGRQVAHCSLHQTSLVGLGAPDPSWPVRLRPVLPTLPRSCLPLPGFGSALTCPCCRRSSSRKHQSDACTCTGNEIRVQVRPCGQLLPAGLAGCPICTSNRGQGSPVSRLSTGSWVHSS